MNWGAIGAIGEIVGAIAVVATLLYLAIQTGRTRSALEASGTLSTAELFSRWRTAFIQCPDLAQIVAKANSGDTLLEDEKLKFSIFCDEIFFSVAVSYITIAHSGAVHENTAEIDYLISLIARMPALESEWRRMHGQIEAVSPTMVATIDKRLRDRDCDT